MKAPKIKTLIAFLMGALISLIVIYFLEFDILTVKNVSNPNPALRLQVLET